MKVAIVGAGAIGLFLGTHLARAGAEVSAIARGATAEALRVLEAGGFRSNILEAVVAAFERSSALGEESK